MLPNLRRPNAFLFIFLFAAFIKPVGLSHPLIDRIYILWKVLAIAYLVLALLPRMVKPFPSKRTLGLYGLAMFWGIYLINCIFVGEDVVSVGIAGISSLLLLLLIFYETEIGNGMLMLKSLSWLFTFYVLAHVVSVILVEIGFPVFDRSDVSPVYLFGMDNYSAFFLYPMVTVVLYYNTIKQGKFGVFGSFLLILVTGIYLFTMSVTAAGAGLVMLLLYSFKWNWSRLPKIKNVRWVIIVMAVMLVLICGFQIQQILASVLDAMSKGVTLNSRTIIWEYVLKLVKTKPLFGYGAFTPKQLYEEYVMYGTTHAHNLLLELLLRTGVVGMAAYMCFLFGFAPWGKKVIVPTAHGVLLVGLVAQLVLFFMDYYPTITVFYIFMGILYTSHRFHCVGNKETAGQSVVEEETL